MLAERGNVWAEKIHKNPANGQHNYKFLKPNSQDFLFDEFFMSLTSAGAANKVVKQDLKFGQNLL